MFFGLVVVLMLVLISYLGISRMGEIEENLKYSTDVLLKSIEKLIQADRDLNQALVSERTLLQTEPGSVAFKNLVRDINENIRQCKERVGYYQAHATLPEQRRLLEAFAADFQKWQDIDQEVIKLAQDKSPVSRQRAAVLSLTTGNQQFETARGYLDKLEEISLDFAAQRKAEARHHYLQATRSIVVILILVVIFCLFIGATTWRAVTVPLAAIINFTQRVADGDLSETLPVSAHNEMGRLTEPAPPVFTNPTFQQPQGFQLQHLVKSVNNPFSLNYLFFQGTFSKNLICHGACYIPKSRLYTSLCQRDTAPGSCP